MQEVQIHNTTDYASFKIIHSNRKVDKRHVTQLKKAIQGNNLLHLNPIIVNDQMEVIDGQHRLQSAKELQLPVYYLVDNAVNKKNIAGLNSNQKHWSMMDYANYFIAEGIPEYQVLKKFIDDHPAVPITTLIQLLNPYGERNTKGFKEGDLNVSNQEKAKLVLDHIEKIRNLSIELAYDRNFILAIVDAFKNKEYKPEQFLTKLEGNRMELFKCAKKHQYLQLIESIFNKHQHTKVRFY